MPLGPLLPTLFKLTASYFFTALSREGVPSTHPDITFPQTVP